MTRRARVVIPMLVSLCALPPARLAAQVRVAVTAGARYTTRLVHDVIVTPFDVRAALAPALSVDASLPLDPPWRLAAVLDLSHSTVSRYDTGATVAPITGLTTVALGLGLTRPLQPWLVGRGVLGAVKYFPGERTGLFQDGGPFFPFAQLALDAAPAFAARRGLAIELRYDIHKFTTPALRDEGFISARVIHRVALGIRVAVRRSP
ncbi:MAG TPA: hypothetical protein VI160_07600 [Gemmatimonadales bacterium]